MSLPLHLGQKSLTHLAISYIQAEDVFTQEDASKERAVYKEHLDGQLKAADGYKPVANMLGGQWAGMVWPASSEGLAGKNPETGVNVDRLKEIGFASVRTPLDFVSIS